MLWLLLACSDDTSKADSSSVAGVEYYGSIDALVATNCARCHTTNGQARSFDDPLDVQAMAPAMLARVQAGEMPPPAPDPSCRDYQGSDLYRISDEEKALLQEWVDAGAPLGDPSHASSPATPPTLAPFDQELYGSQSYQPSFSDGENDYRCFRLDMNNTDTLYMTGMEALIDNASIVHHVVIFNATGLNVSSDPSGFSCDGFGESNWEYMVGWAPGSQPLLLPDGMGMPLAANSTLVLQMHYFNSFDGADQEQDQSGFGLKFTDSVDKEVFVYGLGTTGFTIPADNSAYESSDNISWRRNYGTGHVLGVWPHMHLLGSGFDMSVTHPDASSDCLVHMDGWDFHNQVSALYTESYTLNELDNINITCHYDNSTTNPNQPNDPPQDVYWGEGTTDEMCFGFTYLTVD